MHIKEVTIRGFRTYRHSTTIHFSPGYNCIVGANGSGKSNVLLAIAFALGEGGQSSTERRMLLHVSLKEVSVFFSGRPAGRAQLFEKFR
ncbi:RecF/RecN/SMC amine-terminal domain protein, partial [Toxoplasma gondii GAB2-2007-GAL-DOM2]